MTGAERDQREYLVALERFGGVLPAGKPKKRIRNIAARPLSRLMERLTCGQQHHMTAAQREKRRRPE